MNIFKRAITVAALFATFGAGIVLATSFTATADTSWGPNRTLMAWSPTVAGFDHVTFNSFTGVSNGIGDEPNFFTGVVAGRDATWTNPVTNISAGDTVEAHVYIDNDAEQSLNASGVGVAKDVTVRVALPTGVANTQTATAYISASNAEPETVYDNLELDGSGTTQFGVNYAANTAVLHEDNGTTVDLTAAQTAQMFGANGLDIGNQEGCIAHLQEITFEMNIATPNYSLTKVVGLAGSSTATQTNSFTANPGDTLGWMLTFKNTGGTVLQNVAIVDNVPTGLTIVPGSVKLFDESYPNGYVYPSDAIQENGRQINIGVGTYNPGDDSYVTYRTTIDTGSTLTCGVNSLVNDAYATPQGLGTIEATATVTTTKSCPTTPTPTTTTTTTTTTPTATVTTAAATTTLPNTGPGDVIGLFAGVSAIAAVVYRKFLARRLS